MSRFIFAVVFLTSGLVFGEAVVAGPVLTFDQSLGGTGLNRDQTVGWEFSVVEPVTLTHLTWFDQDQDGLSTSHRVGLWDPNGQLVISATIPIGTSSILDGIWRTINVQDLTLSVGSGYIIGGTNRVCPIAS